MKTVEDIASEIMRYLGSLSDTGDEDHILRFHLHLLKGLLQSVQYPEVPASWAPGDIDISHVIR
jgi:hypothetical protein